MATGDKKSANELDSGRESVLSAYNELLEAKRHFRNAAEAAGMDLKDEVLEQLLEGREKAADIGRQSQDLVNDRPLASLGIAFGIGVLVSQLLSRK